MGVCIVPCAVEISPARAFDKWSEAANLNFIRSVSGENPKNNKIRMLPAFNFSSICCD